MFIVDAILRRMLGRSKEPRPIVNYWKIHTASNVFYMSQDSIVNDISEIMKLLENAKDDGKAKWN